MIKERYMLEEFLLPNELRNSWILWSGALKEYCVILDVEKYIYTVRTRNALTVAFFVSETNLPLFLFLKKSNLKSGGKNILANKMWTTKLIPHYFIENLLSLFLSTDCTWKCRTSGECNRQHLMPLFQRKKRKKPDHVVPQHTVSFDDFLWGITAVITENSADDNRIWQYEGEVHWDLQSWLLYRMTMKTLWIFYRIWSLWLEKNYSVTKAYYGLD